MLLAQNSRRIRGLKTHVSITCVTGRNQTCLDSWYRRFPGRCFFGLGPCFLRHFWSASKATAEQTSHRADSTAKQRLSPKLPAATDCNTVPTTNGRVDCSDVARPSECRFLLILSALSFSLSRLHHPQFRLRVRIIWLCSIPANVKKRLRTRRFKGRLILASPSR